MTRPPSTGLVSRRRFLQWSGLTLAAAPLGGVSASRSPESETLAEREHEARFYEKLHGGAVRCGLCPWGCVVPPGGRGRCRVRENRGGRYVTLVYGRPVARNNDPIEKKPFFHVYPGSRAYSIATVGCNFVCKFCQNWDISQAAPEQARVPFVPPEAIAAEAARQQCRTIAYTYSEPTIFFEYMLDCARAARDAGLGNVLVSNGFIADAPLRELCKVMTAIKVDFKAFSDSFYRDVCSGEREPVLATLKRLKDSGVWFEMVVLIIPTLNDRRDEIRRMCDWILRELGPDVPLHFTRFHPAYRLLNLPPTPTATLEQARALARQAGCRYVYTGNMPGGAGENTDCPQCGARVVNRYGHLVLSDSLKDGKCPACGAAIPGVWF